MTEAKLLRRIICLQVEEAMILAQLALTPNTDADLIKQVRYLTWRMERASELR